jgi:thiol-disulfide isomerase/thioredoxin
MNEATASAEPGLAPPRRLVLAVAGLAVGGSVLTWLLRGASDDRATAALRASGAEIQRRPLSQGERTVELELAPAAGQAAKKARFGEVLAAQRPTLVHLWASWCPPCLDELPHLIALAKHLVGQRIELLAVSYDDDWQAADEVLRKVTGKPRPDGIRWLRDPAGQDGDPATMLRVKMGTDQLPETYLITGAEVRARFVSSQQWTSPPVLQALEFAQR